MTATAIQAGAGMQQPNALKGVLLVCAAVFLFALADVVTKHLTMRYPVSVVVAVRYLVNLALLLAILWPKHRSNLWKTERTGAVLLRGVCLAAASLTMGIALRLMPVGETVAIVYLSPFAVMLLAVPLLGERVSLAGWIGAIFGFFGVLLIVRPGSGLDPVGVAFALLNAGCATAYHLSTRFLARTETTIALLFHTTLVGAIIFCVLAAGSLDGFAPTPTDMGLMVVLGALAAAGHFLFTASYREAPASFLAPVNYLHLVWAGVLGFVFFGHVPDTWGAIGMATVALAGMTVALRAHLARN